MRIDETTKSMARVSVDCALAMLIVMVIGAILLVTGIAARDSGDEVSDVLTARWAAYELTAADPASPAVATLVSRLRAEVSNDRAVYLVQTERRNASVWVVAWFITSEARRATNDTVSASGLWTGRVTIGSVWGNLLADSIRDPLSVVDKLAWLTPLFVVCSGVAFLVAGAGFRRLRPVPGFEATPPPSWKEAMPKGIAIGLAGMSLAAAVSTVAAALGLEGSEQQWILELAAGNPLATATLVVLAVGIAPLGEELFFRGHVFRYLAGNAGLLPAYAGSAVLFSIAHFNPGATPSYVVAALVLGWSYQRWRSLRIPMISHAAWNAVAATLLLVS